MAMVDVWSCQHEVYVCFALVCALLGVWEVERRVV